MHDYTVFSYILAFFQKIKSNPEDST